MQFCAACFDYPAGKQRRKIGRRTRYRPAHRAKPKFPFHETILGTR